MKIQTTLIGLCVLLAACGIEEVDVKFGARPKPNVQIKQKCELIKQGMEVTEAKKIMEKASTTKEYNQYNYGHYTFWNRPILEDSDDLMPLIFQQGETCKVYFNSDQRVTKIEYIFITQEQYQDKVNMLKNKMENKADEQHSIE